MANELQPIGRQVATPTQNIASDNSFDTLGQAAGQLGSLISSKLNAVAIEQAAQQGALDATKGELPKNLALPFTAATKAYNDAGAKIEANRVITSAHAQVSEALVNATNPATFTRETPVQFQATTEGIIQGTLENARPENRAEISSAMLDLSSNASLKMLQHSIDFDNKQTLADYQADVTKIEAQLKNATIVGDTNQIAFLNQEFKDTVDNYSVRNEQIKASAPLLREKFQEQQVINNQLGEFAKATSEGSKSKFLAGFMKNESNLTVAEWQSTAKELVQLEGVERKLGFEAHAEANAQVTQDIKNQVITTPEQIRETPNLTALQTITSITSLEDFNRTNFKNSATILQAQKDIMQGNPQAVKPSVADDMYNNWRGNVQALTGQVPNVFDAWAAWKGDGPFPLSGIKGQRFGRDVPELNRDVTAMLTNHDPVQIVQAASLFKETNLSAKEGKFASPIVLTGDALDVASSFNVLDRGGLDAEGRGKLAERINNSIFNATEPEREVRRQRANTFTAKQADMEKIYEDKFGMKFVPGLSDATMGIMKENLKLSIQNTGNTDAAIEANKFLMKGYRDSIYFPKGMTSDNAPENLPIFSVGNALQNQFGSAAQGLIDDNAEFRKTLGVDQVPFKIEWQKPNEQRVDLSTEPTDEEKVFGNMGGMLKTLRQISQESTERDLPGFTEATGEAEAPVPHGRIPVKINGFKTELYFQPTAESGLGKRTSYALFYTDQTGQPQPVPDITRPDNVARFIPAGLARWAPAIFEAGRSEEMKDIAVRTNRERARAELEALKTPLFTRETFGKELLSRLITRQDEVGDILRLQQSDPDKARELARAIDGKDVQEALDILRKRIGGDEALEPETPEAKAAQADNVGIAADTGARPDGMITPGNIDLSTRPQVKNKDGSISTVRSITVEMDGKHFVIPTVTDDGKIVSNKKAIQIAKDTGKNLGVFETAKQANEFAQALHESEAKKLDAGEIQPGGQSFKEPGVFPLPKPDVPEGVSLPVSLTPTEEENQQSDKDVFVTRVFKTFAKVEGDGSGVKGDVKTTFFGVTQSALDALKDKRDLKKLTKDEAEQVSKNYLSQLNDKLTKSIPEFSDAPQAIKDKMLSSAYNAGPGGLIKNVQPSKHDGSWTDSFKEMLRFVGQAPKGQPPKALIGLALRRADEYNVAAAQEGRNQIKFIEQTKDKIIYTDTDKNIIATVKMPIHSSSKAQKTKVKQVKGSK